MSEISIHKIGQAVGSYVAKKVCKFEQAEYLSYGAEILLGSILKLSILFFTAFMLDVISEVTVLLIIIGLIRTLFAISIILGRNSLIAWKIAFGLLWQAFTLIPVGHTLYPPFLILVFDL